MDKHSLSNRISLSGCFFAAVVVLLVLIVQVSPGISNVDFSLPLTVAVAHNGVAALLLLTMVTLVHVPGQQKQA